LSADYRSISDFLFLTARRYPDFLAVTDDAGSLTYGELAARAAAFGGSLRTQGLQPGDRVVLQLPNSADFLIAHFGIMWAGGVSVPVDAAASAHSLAEVVAAVEARWVFVRPAQLPLVELALRAVSSQAHVEAMRMEPVIALPQEPAPTVEPGKLACLLFTTGSTALPKGVPLRHENVCAAVENLVRLVGYTQRDREVIVLPIAHSFGLGHVYCNFRVGGAVRLVDGLSKVGRVLKILRDFGATGFPGTPLGFGLLLDRYAEPFLDAARQLRFIVVNSAALPASRAKQLLTALPDTTLYVYYGLTEASRSTMHALNSVAEERLTSVGPAMYGIDVRIDGEDGQPLPPRCVGQVTIAGPTVPGSYWRDDAATAEGYRDGRLQSGDLGYLDEEGYLFLTGRLKDQINLGGTKIAAVEIEEALREHPDVDDCVVLGMPSHASLETEAVVAGVVLRAAATLDVPALQKHLRGRLEPYKVPTEIHAISAVPRAPTGKLLRQRARALVALLRGDT
jgi:long-chain acyl-CoA synthetase